MSGASAALRSGVETEPVLGLDIVEALFDHLPDAAFALKDAALRYQAANAAMLDLCGTRARTDVIGKRATDFFPDAARYEAWDRQVLRTHRPIKDRLDYCWRLRGRPVWVLMNVWPVAGQDPAAAGVAYVSRVLQAPDRRQPTYERLAEVIEHIHSNLGSQIDIAALARRANISVSQLERDFVKLLGVPPRRYLTKVRFEAALDLLKAGGSIADVAHACGYADQSAFTRRFRSAIGMSPSEFRRASAVTEFSAQPRA